MLSHMAVLDASTTLFTFDLSTEVEATVALRPAARARVVSGVLAAQGRGALTRVLARALRVWGAHNMDTGR